MAKQLNKINLKTDKVSKVFLSYAIPSLIAILAQKTAGLIDSIFIGRFVGANGLSAITLIMPFIFLFDGVATMLAIGGSTLAGISKGQGDEEKSNNYFVVTTYLVTSIAIVATILLFVSGNFISSALNVTGEVSLFIKDYTKTLSLFALPFVTSFALMFFLKLDGNPKAVVKTTISGTIINIILNYVFIVICKWGMFGAALATGISQLVPFLIFMYLIIYKSDWQFTKPNFNKKDLLNMVFNGSSELMTMASVSIAGFIYNALIIKHVGLMGVGAYSVAMQVASISTSISYGIADAVQSPVSYNIGANQLNRVKAFRKLAIYTNLVAGIFIGVMSVVFSDNIIRLFTTDLAIAKLAAFILNFYALSFSLKGINIALTTYYTSVNSPLISCIIALSRSLVAFITGLYLMPLIFNNNGIWVATIFAELVTVIIAFVFLIIYPFGSKSKKTNMVSV